MSMKHVEKTRECKRDNTTMRVTKVECTLLLPGKVQIGKIANAQRDLAIEEFHLHCVVVERKDLITNMTSMLVTNNHPNAKDENPRKFFDPKLLTATDGSKET